MLRNIIKIDKEKCNGCGLCVSACQEGAIGLVDGKAELLRDDYCDGLGNCLPVCPTGAISFEEREALEFDEEAVMKNMGAGVGAPTGGCPGTSAKTIIREEYREPETLACGCPGTNAKAIVREQDAEPETDARPELRAQADARTVLRAQAVASQLAQWPVQIKLVPVNAPYFAGANLLVAADCAAYAYGGFHNDFMKKKVTIIGCPKLDDGDYSEKLADIIRKNDIKSVTVVRMEVPCCGGIENAVKEALIKSGKMIPWQVVTISTDGKILD